MSSLITSCFDATGRHVAYIVQTLDTETLKVQSIGGEESDHTVTVHPFDKKKNPRVKSLLWLSSDTLGVIFRGSNKFILLNILSNEVTSTLKTDQLISSLTVSKSSHGKIYVVDSNSDLLEYQLEADFSGWKLDKSYRLDDVELRTVHRLLDLNERYLFLFSNSVYLFDKKEGKVTDFKNLYVSPINCAVECVSNNSVIVSADNDRFINLISVSEDGKIVIGEQILVAEGPVIEVTHYQIEEFNLELVVALTEGRILEIFNDPFTKRAQSNTSDKKKRRKGPAVQSQRSDCKVELARKGTNESMSIEDITIDPRYLTIVWMEDSSYLAFDRIEWWQHPNDGEYRYRIVRDTKLIKDRPMVNLGQNKDKHGDDRASAKHYKESNAIVSSGDNFRDLETNSENREEEELEDEDFGHLAEKFNIDNKKRSTNGKKGKLQVGSLTVVLSQALKSNDHGLFESVLNNNRDENVIRNTVARLDTTYVLALLDRLSERLGRGKGARNRQIQQQLDTWVKYILIYHGSYLISLPNLAADLNLLSNSLRIRARNLNRLLDLRAKIGLVTDRMEMKRELGKQLVVDRSEEVDGEEENVEYNEEVDDAGLEEDDVDDDDDYGGSNDNEMDVDSNEVYVGGEQGSDDEQYSDVEGDAS
ncbi:hypothetical protein FOA43_003918 [Brettanomyces nanus]|uniref:Small-subunit processome Utp12 domain-containing protein n=1 Tax=Eeniella nana TaxID=13502 RepID=A0A875SAB6_EENNA|nr:uncharacterized protein FOA43_003918 [Brettanomyces nanus]QPG76529.1 hypothetical protein FOA43_003918 [Brettanomyces nanus]